jgi:hypothetical protein
LSYLFFCGGHEDEWLRRCATSRTVLGSIPGGVTGFFCDTFPSDRTMALGSTQPPVKISTRNFPGSKGGRCVRLTTSPPSRAERRGIWEPKRPGTLLATPGLLRASFTFTLPLNPLLITCDYLRKEPWVSFRPLWKVLASVDMILLLLAQQVEYKFSDKSSACLYIYPIFYNFLLPFL